MIILNYQKEISFNKPYHINLSEYNNDKLQNSCKANLLQIFFSQQTAQLEGRDRIIFWYQSLKKYKKKTMPIMIAGRTEDDNMD